MIGQRCRVTIVCFVIFRLIHGSEVLNGTSYIKWKLHLFLKLMMSWIPKILRNLKRLQYVLPPDIVVTIEVFCSLPFPCFFKISHIYSFVDQTDNQVATAAKSGPWRKVGSWGFLSLHVIECCPSIFDVIVKYLFLLLLLAFIYVFLII